MLKWIRRIIIVSAAGAVLLAVGLALVSVYLNSDSGKIMVQDYLNRRIAGKLHWDDLNIGLSTGKVGINNLRLEDLNGSESAGADSVQLNLSILSLVTGKLRFQEAIVEAPWAEIRIDESGNNNLARALSFSPMKKESQPGGKGDGLFQVTADRFQVASGAISFADPGKSISLDLAEISVWGEELEISAPDGRFDAQVRDGGFESPYFSGELNRFRLSADLSPERQSPLEIQLAIGGSSVDISGSVTNLDSDSRLDLILKGLIDFSDIPAFQGERRSSSGTAELDASIKGSLTNPEAELDITYQGGLLWGVPLERLSSKILFSELRAEIESLTADAAAGSLTATGNFDLTESLPQGFFSRDPRLDQLRYSLEINSNQLQLQKLLKREADYQGTVNGTIALERQGLRPGNIFSRIEATLDVDRILAPGMDRPTAASVELHGRAEGTGLFLDSLEIKSPEMEVSGNGEFDTENKDVQGNLNLSAASLGELLSLLGIERVTGEGTLEISLDGTYDRPEADINATGRNLTVYGSHAQSMTFQAGLQSSGMLEIEKLLIENPEAEADISGRFPFLIVTEGQLPGLNSDPLLDLEGTLNDYKLSDIRDTERFQGIIDGTFRVAGYARNPEIEGRLEIRDLVIGPENIDSVTGTVIYSEGEAKTDRLMVQDGDSYLVFSGSAKILDSGSELLPRPLLNIEIDESLLSAQYLSPNAAGKISVTGSILGDLGYPEAALQVSGEDLQYQAIAIGNLKGNPRLEEGRLTLPDLELVNQGSKINLSGTATILAGDGTGFLEDPEIDLELSGDSVNLADFSSRLAGISSIDGELGGSILRPEGFVALSGEELDFWGQSVNSFALRLEMDGDIIRLERFTAEIAPGERITGTGTINLSSDSYQVGITSQNLSLSSINYLKGNSRIEGNLKLDLSGRGTLDDPGVEGRLSVSNILINQKSLDDILLRMSLDRDSLQVWGQPGFDLYARYSPGSREFSASALLVSTQLAPYFRVLGLESFTGEIDGNIEASGRIGDPDSITIEAELTDLIMSADDQALLSASDIRAGLMDGELVLRRTGIEVLGEGRLFLEGRGSLDGNIKVSLQGDIPAAGISPFLDHEDELEGNLRINATLEGPEGNRSVSGNMDLENVAFYLPGIAQKLENVSGRVAMDSNLIRTDSIQGNIEGGKFTLSGSVLTAAFRPSMYDIRITTSGLPIELRDRMSLVMDSTFSLQGPFGKPELDGRITLLNAVYYKDVELSLLKAISSREREVSPESFTGRLSYLNNVQLDILVRSRRSIRVENNLAMMSLIPDLRIRGTLGEPIITGRASVEDGIITYQRSRFSIRNGVVDFLNPYRTEPNIDIEGETEVRDWLISLNVSGTLDNLDFRLNSDPSESQADLLSLLLLGRTTDEIRISGAGSGVYAGQLIGGLLAGAVGSGLREATGLDIVELDFSGGSGTRSQGSEDVELILGKELSRRLTIKYGAEFKRGDSVQKVTSEYKMLEDFILSLFQDTEGNVGGAITYQVEFR